MKPGEAEALTKAKEEVAHERELTFTMAREFDRADDATLATMGQRKGKDVAIAEAFRSGQKKIDAIWKDFLKRFPDEK